MRQCREKYFKIIGNCTCINKGNRYDLMRLRPERSFVFRVPCTRRDIHAAETNDDWLRRLERRGQDVAEVRCLVSVAVELADLEPSPTSQPHRRSRIRRT
jgi:hypothetical protein